ILRDVTGPFANVLAGILPAQILLVLWTANRGRAATVAKENDATRFVRIDDVAGRAVPTFLVIGRGIRIVPHVMLFVVVNCREHGQPVSPFGRFNPLLVVGMVWPPVDLAPKSFAGVRPGPDVHPGGRRPLVLVVPRAAALVGRCGDSRMPA